MVSLLPLAGFATEEKPVASVSNGVELFTAALQQLSNLIEPASSNAPRTFSAQWAVTQAEGVPKEFAKAHGEIALQSPDRARGSVTLGKQEFVLGRDQQELWVHTPGKKFGVIGKSGVPRFLTAPEKIDKTLLPPIKLPLPKEQLALLPLVCDAGVLADREIDKGRLEMIDGTKMVYLEGTPEEMGHQHGVLLKKSVRDLVERVLYGVGVGSSFEKGRWFFGEIEEAQKHIEPFIEDRYLREMDAIALATKLDREEIRLANYFPELFHCSGFAVFGNATADGKLYHG